LFKKVIYLMVVLSLFSVLHSQTRNYFFDRLTIEDGLSQGTVTSIVQDKTGFMWFGTYDGLNRYDGIKFKVFKNDGTDSTTLSHNSITSIFEDAKGNLWIGTMAGGLNLYNPDKENFTHFKHNPKDSTSLSNDIARYIHEDRRGNLWIGTWGGGLNLMDRTAGTFKHFIHETGNPNALSGNQVNFICEDRSGNLWIATSNGVCLFDTENKIFKTYNHNPRNKNSISHNDITCVFVDPKGFVWAGTWGEGLNKIDPLTGKVTRFHHNPDNPNSLSHNIVRFVYADAHGVVYVATWGGGISIYNPDKNNFTHIKNVKTDFKSLSGDFIYTLYKDKTGILWIGTDYHGVNKYDESKQKFTHYKLDKISTNSVTSIVRDKKGVFWLGTAGGGVVSFKHPESDFVNYRHQPHNPNSLVSNVVKSLYIDDNYIWIATELGLNRLHPETGKIRLFKHDPPDSTSISFHNIWRLLVDSRGDLWVGTYSGGLNKLDRASGTFKHYKHNPDNTGSISNNFIWSVIEGKQGNIWIGTDNGGLNRLDPETEKFTSFKHDPQNPNSLSDNKVISIYQDQDGIFWIGTPGGLNRFDPEENSFSVFRTENGLPSNSIQSILEDDNDNLWLTTNNGLSRFNKKQFTVQNFNESNGLQGNEFNVNSAFKDENGWMYIGGINGINVFHPDSIKRNPHIPNVVLTDFKLFNQEVPVGLAGQGKYSLEKSITVTDQIQLSYDQNVISFEFAGLNYSYSKNNRYAYMMEGFDEDWIYSGNRNFVTYTNLPAGLKYTFKVKASNNDGVWNNSGRSLAIYISPPFWMTWWFILSAMVLTFYLIFIIIRFRTKNIKEKNLILAAEISRRKTAEEQVKYQNSILERAVEKKTLEMEALMEKMIRQERLATIGQVSASIAHELRNPLGAVKQSVYFLRKKMSGEPDKIAKHLDLINSELSIANRVIDDLLEMAHIKNTAKEYINIEPLLEEALKTCHVKKNIDIIKNYSKEARFIWVDPVQIRQVFVNLITNSNQAMEEGGKLIINSALTNDGVYIKITIADTGQGISKSELDKIFEPLYTTKAKGTGLGLSICKQIIDKHNGKIEINSRKKQGTKISVLLPVNGAEK
jgi:ligand-binding sensor domain-containing protein/signal transduction histidine kinase